MIDKMIKISCIDDFCIEEIEDALWNHTDRMCQIDY